MKRLLLITLAAVGNALAFLMVCGLGLLILWGLWRMLTTDSFR